MHPVLIAVKPRCSTILSEGRFILGVSPGALTTDAEALGILDQDRNNIFAEAIDVILAIWERDPPYDIDFPDNRFKVSTRKRTWRSISASASWPSPIRSRGPEIVGTVVAPFSPGVVLMGKRDFHPLSANFLLSKHLKSHWENYCKGKAGGRRRGERGGLAGGAGDLRSRRRQDRGALRSRRSEQPIRFYFEQMRAKMKRGKRLYVFKCHKEQPDEEITHDYVMDNCVIHGSVNKVVDEILALREETGDFGELVYAGMDWADRRSASARCS